MHRRFLLLAAVGASSAAQPAYAHRSELAVQRIAQQTPSWCWAATASMALKYLGFPDINPVRNYQCGVVAAAFPKCEEDCTKCDVALGTMPGFVDLLERYRDRTETQLPTALQASFHPNYASYPEFGRIKQSIDLSYPVIGGISKETPSDPERAEHSILITGYDDDYLGTGEPWLVVLDPYPYARGESPWIKAGYPARRSAGRLMVPWRFMRERMNLTSAVFLEERSA